MTPKKSYLKETYVALIAAFAVGIVTNAIWGILVFIAIGLYVSRNDPIPEVNPMDDNFDLMEGDKLTSPEYSYIHYNIHHDD